MQRMRSACWTTIRSCNTSLAMYVALVQRDGCQLCARCALTGEAAGSRGVEQVCNPSCGGVDWPSGGRSIDRPHRAAFFLSDDWMLRRMGVSSFSMPVGFPLHARQWRGLQAGGQEGHLVCRREQGVGRLGRSRGRSRPPQEQALRQVWRRTFLLSRRLRRWGCPWGCSCCRKSCECACCMGEVLFRQCPWPAAVGCFGLLTCAHLRVYVRLSVACSWLFCGATSSWLSSFSCARLPPDAVMLCSALGLPTRSPSSWKGSQSNFLHWPPLMASRLLFFSGVDHVDVCFFCTVVAVPAFLCVSYSSLSTERIMLSPRCYRVSSPAPRVPPRVRWRRFFFPRLLAAQFFLLLPDSAVGLLRVTFACTHGRRQSVLWSSSTSAAGARGRTRSGAGLLLGGVDGVPDKGVAPAAGTLVRRPPRSARPLVGVGPRPRPRRQ